MTEKALTTTTPINLVPTAAIPLDQHPAAVYLASLSEEASALQRVPKAVLSGERRIFPLFCPSPVLERSYRAGLFLGPILA